MAMATSIGVSRFSTSKTLLQSSFSPNRSSKAQTLLFGSSASSLSSASSFCFAGDKPIAAIVPRQQKPVVQERTPLVVIPKTVSDSKNSQTCLDPDASKSVLGIILGEGAGTRLYPLTKKQAKPAVPLGANYRLIDIPVSNCLNSNISNIYVLTQINSASLNCHLSRAYGSNMGGYKNEGFVEVLPAQQNWFQLML